MREFPKGITSKYKFVTVASRRCAQLLSGSRPRIEIDGMLKMTTVAMNEVLDNKVEFFDKASEEETPATEEA